MGERGPGKMPTPLKLLHGERRESRLNRGAPRPRSGRPVMPADMSAAAKTVWRRVMRDFGATGILTPIDADGIRAFCEAAARYRTAAVMLEASGPLVRGQHKGELVKNPLHQVVRDNAVLLRAFARDLGFLPSARESLTGRGELEDDPLAAWAAR